MSGSNSANQSQPARGGGLSLYANLLDPSGASSSATVSKGPVMFKTSAPDNTEEASAKKPIIDPAALRFQPTKRPQLSQKPKPKTTFPKPAVSDAISKVKSKPVSQTTALSSAPRPAKSKFTDWTGDDDEDVNGFYGGGEKRQRGGRKRRKNKHSKEEHVAVQDWDDIYDPTRPNSYEEYKHSDEKIREVREWKDRLYAHRMARRSESEKDSDEEEYRPQLGKQFAPPPNYSFAPPPMDSPKSKPTNMSNVDTPLSPYNPKSSMSPPPAPSTVPPAAAVTAEPTPTVSTATISRAPVRYNLPPPPSEIPSSEAELEKALAEEPDDDEPEDAEEAPRSLRPGQKGFAERLMSKYGWSKGKGLGAEESGIVNPLRVQIEKRKKKSDAEGGGFRDTGGRGKIIGGKKNIPEKDSDAGKFGDMSEVIVLKGMVDGMDLDAEVEGAGDGGIMQEIGDECGEKYGRVERVYIDRHQSAPKVFVKFTSQLSALRAVNALEGRIFNGNTISALFYETEKFEKGIYE